MIPVLRRQLMKRLNKYALWTLTPWPYLARQCSKSKLGHILVEIRRTSYVQNALLKPHDHSLHFWNTPTSSPLLEVSTHTLLRTHFSSLLPCLSLSCLLSHKLKYCLPKEESSGHLLTPKQRVRIGNWLLMHFLPVPPTKLHEDMNHVCLWLLSNDHRLTNIFFSSISTKKARNI